MSGSSLLVLSDLAELLTREKLIWKSRKQHASSIVWYLMFTLDDGYNFLPNIKSAFAFKRQIGYVILIELFVNKENIIELYSQFPVNVP